MFWEQVQKLPDNRFKRATGVHKEIFGQMLEVVTGYKTAHGKHPTRGKPPKLSWADKILMMLIYYREYRTMEHIGITYSVSESRVCEIIQEMESILIGDQQFHLPGKKKKHTIKTQVIAEKKTDEFYAQHKPKEENMILNIIFPNVRFCWESEAIEEKVA